MGVEKLPLGPRIGSWVFPLGFGGPLNFLSGAGLGQGFKRPQSTQIPTKMWEESPACFGRASSRSLHQKSHLRFGMETSPRPKEGWGSEYTHPIPGRL